MIIRAIYTAMKRAGVEINSHESDMYVPVNEVTQSIVDQYDYKCNVSRFISEIDGKPWFDIPFSYKPFWDTKTINR